MPNSQELSWDKLERGGRSPCHVKPTMRQPYHERGQTTALFEFGKQTTDRENVGVSFDHLKWNPRSQGNADALGFAYGSGDEEDIAFEQ